MFVRSELNNSELNTPFAPNRKHKLKSSSHAGFNRSEGERIVSGRKSEVTEPGETQTGSDTRLMSDEQLDRLVMGSGE